jgi:DNA-binding winged helix-turn-helix (wHTH) protein/cytochrome c-type biogenesis protein CcmH/NrfG
MHSSRFAFGSFAFDGARRLLFEGGVPVALGQRAPALLGVLLAARGDVVAKAALMDAAWPGLFVEESNLTVQIATLRKRLGTCDGGGEWIATLPRIGYRFAGPFTVEHEAPPAVIAVRAEPPSAARTAGVDLRAYEFYVQGRSLLLRSQRGNGVARAYLLNAVRRSPSFAPALAALGVAHFGDALYYGRDAETNRAAGWAYARAAAAIDPDHPFVSWVLGYMHLYSGKMDEARREWQAALARDPDQPEVLAKMGDLLVQDGEVERGIGMVERALEIDPWAPPCTWWDLGFARYAAGRYAEAVAALQRDELEGLPSRRILAASLAQLGHMDEARAAARRFLEETPGFRIATWTATQSFKHRAEREHFIDGYRKAGLPA